MKKLAMATVAVLGLSIAASASAAVDEFRIGILGGENAQDRLNNHECLREKTEDLLGVPTKLFAPADYNGVIQGLLGGTIDLAWLGASSYAKIWLTDADAVEPILVKVNVDGGYGYHSIGFARKDSGIKSLDDMKGKTFAFGDPNSTSGYLIPSIEIPAQGYSMEKGDYFGDIVFSGGHEQTIVAVANGDVDAGVTWADGLGDWEEGYNSGALRKASDSGIVDMGELVQIWQSNPIPEGPIVVRKDLPAYTKMQMTGLIASMQSMDSDCAYNMFAGEAKGVMPITHEAYTSIIEARKLKSN
ncbi:phosphonate ABC transporter substrate-binding protein [Reinekea thalattae]|uniref:Phosphonate ABC transporter substrate-binding protein n=1 Tax=Reinekea thalattae TaxID=2593301 RepID=A0A5C8Z9A6_9GAMM|nr:phosphonate ABC transporter substrate-binding protein [Reinekea thalattae]TXR54522.1 phosphonate ABC transporter substrate-binding protein [Reinekea thalattae]